MLTSLLPSICGIDSCTTVACCLGLINRKQINAKNRIYKIKVFRLPSNLSESFDFSAVESVPRINDPLYKSK